MRFVGAAWSIACVFAIPVLITDENASNPIQVLKKSALTLKQTWGEALIGYAGVSFGGLLILLGSICWVGAGVWVATTLHVLWLTVVVVAAWVITLCLWVYVLSVASQIFRCALCVFATQGTLPEPYTQELMALAWKTKRR